ncbi:MoxR family ATPase [soil metagenome]
MQKVTPAGFAEAVERAWTGARHRPIFGWGPPGIGKTDLVNEVAGRLDVRVAEFRLGQLTPSDLRGMPVVDHDARVTRFYPPEDLPRSGAGILLLDEYPQAVPVMQGLAQQLLLERRLGSYVLPPGWLVVGLGNRKQDRASVFDMPSQVENRFKHYLLQPDLEEWRTWAAGAGIHEHVIAFLSFRPELLHAYDPLERAWPSPRSWHAASEDHALGGSIVSSVGDAAGREFEAYVRMHRTLPEIDALLAAADSDTAFPEELSAAYAVTAALALRSDTPERAARALRWLGRRATPEWLNLFMTLSAARFAARGLAVEFSVAVAEDPEARSTVSRLAKTLHA